MGSAFTNCLSVLVFLTTTFTIIPTTIAISRCVQKPFDCTELTIAGCKRPRIRDECKWVRAHRGEKKCRSTLPEGERVLDLFSTAIHDCSEHKFAHLCHTLPASSYCIWEIDNDIFHNQDQHATQQLISNAINAIDRDLWEVFQKYDRNNVLGYIRFNWATNLDALPTNAQSKRPSRHQSDEVSLRRNRQAQNILHQFGPWKEDSRVAVGSRLKSESRKPYKRIGVIAMKRGDNAFEVCTANLIAPKWILTAGHCVAQSAEAGGYIFPVTSFRFWRGKNTRVTPDYSIINGYPFDETTGVQANSIYVSHRYMTDDQLNKEERAKYDIALVELTAAVRTEGVSLAYGYYTDNQLRNEDNHFVTVGYPGDKLLFKQYKSQCQVTGLNNMVIEDNKFYTYPGQSGSAFLFWNPATADERYGQYVIAATLSLTDTNLDPKTIWTRITKVRYWFMRYLITKGTDAEVNRLEAIERMTHVEMNADAAAIAAPAKTMDSVVYSYFDYLSDQSVDNANYVGIGMDDGLDIVEYQYMMYVGIFGIVFGISCACAIALICIIKSGFNYVLKQSRNESLV
eukprot:78497_1